MPSGGFVDGGTAVTLVGDGFDGFGGSPNSTLAAFGGLAQQVEALQPGLALVRSPPFYNASAGGAPAGGALHDGALASTADMTGGDAGSMVVGLGISLNGVDFEAAELTHTSPVTHRSVLCAIDFHLS